MRGVIQQSCKQREQREGGTYSCGAHDDFDDLILAGVLLSQICVLCLKLKMNE